jgi:hypothetical protein
MPQGWLLILALGVPLSPAPQQLSRHPACAPLDSTAAWARVNRMWSNETGLHWSNDSLRQVLIALADRDQAARQNFGARIGDSVYARQLMALDSGLGLAMTGILATYGLPTRSLVGAKGADAAMLIVQHNWDLQKNVLALARRIPPGQISPQALAMLEDRVASHSGNRQRFGTQFNLGPGGLFRFAPAIGLAGLESRRARAGLPPMSQYVCMLEEAGMKIDRASLPTILRP